MNNMNWTAEQSGRNQEDRDRFIAEHWGVQTPYVLFSKHHWMHGMPIPENQRWSEMVVYTQIQRSLFDVKKLLDTEVAQHPNPKPFAFYHQVDPWHILVPKETRMEFLRYGETHPTTHHPPSEKSN
jgi:magnesium-dependent phosphatase 1